MAQFHQDTSDGGSRSLQSLIDSIVSPLQAEDEDESELAPIPFVCEDF